MKKYVWEFHPTAASAVTAFTCDFHNLVPNQMHVSWFKASAHGTTSVPAIAFNTETGKLVINYNWGANEGATDSMFVIIESAYDGFWLDNPAISNGTYEEIAHNLVEVINGSAGHS